MVTKSWVQRKMIDWNPVTVNLRKDVRELQTFVTELLLPEAREAVIQLVRENPDILTRNLNATGKWHKRLYWSAWWTARKQLEDEKVLVPTSHGRGRDKTWNLDLKHQFIVPDNYCNKKEMKTP